MADVGEQYPSWTRPIAIFVAVVIFLAVTTALAANVDAIEDWLGLRDRTPVSLSLQIGRLTRPNDNGVVALLSYKKAGPAPLHDCKFWMDTGRLQLLGETPDFELAAGPSSKELQVRFQVTEPWALDFPKASLMLVCDKASSAAVPLNLDSLPVGNG